MKGMRVDNIFSIKDNDTFNKRALEIFHYQVSDNPVYKLFIEYLNIDISKIISVEQIPFLPVEFFRDHRIITGGHSPAVVFESSGTTGLRVSRHYVADTALYRQSLLNAFNMFYGDPGDYMIAALLPSYTERGNSSLVFMMDCLIRKSANPYSGFYSNDEKALITVLMKAKRDGMKIFLMGVSFALLDLAEKYSPDLSGAIIMETGGLKGRRKEITREELHSVLKEGFSVSHIHSEYGMTELLSQAYSDGEGVFRSPPWMKILIRDPHDPFSLMTKPGTSGGINVIDLANIYSCSFISTGDLGRMGVDGTFEVTGRFDNSDIRGCNLLFI